VVVHNADQPIGEGAGVRVGGASVQDDAGSVGDVVGAVAADPFQGNRQLGYHRQEGMAAHPAAVQELGGEPRSFEEPGKPESRGRGVMVGVVVGLYDYGPGRVRTAG
jgi:hypothetical protein